MNSRCSALVSLALLVLAAPAFAADTGAFVVRLGQDTTGVERYTRTPTRIEVDQVGRAPRVLRRHFVYDFANGSMAHVNMVVTPPGSTTPTQTVDASFEADSLRLKIQSGAAPLQNLAVSVPAGTLLIPSSSPWVAYEALSMRLAAGKPDSVRTSMYFLGAPTPNWLTVTRRGRDSVTIFSDHGDLYRAKVDKSGHILGTVPIAGTQKFSIQRVDKLDLDGLTASFAARDQAGAGVGMLSPRDSVKVNAGGASLWIDYGRPGKRGRTVYGGVVPYGEVWRTGANAATQIRTDKDLQFGDVTVPAGFYTLWSLPTPGSWKLVINSETGQWGTMHKAEKDLYTIAMQLSTLPQVVEKFTISVEPNDHGGVLNLDWDTTRASAAFTVKP